MTKAPKAPQGRKVRNPMRSELCSRSLGKAQMKTEPRRGDTFPRDVSPFQGLAFYVGVPELTHRGYGHIVPAGLSASPNVFFQKGQRQCFAFPKVLSRERREGNE